MVKVYTRQYVYYHEIEDDNIRKMADDYQVSYGNYHDICFGDLSKYMFEYYNDDYPYLIDFMNTYDIGENYLIDMSMI